MVKRYCDRCGAELGTYDSEMSIYPNRWYEITSHGYTSSTWEICSNCLSNIAKDYVEQLNDIEREGE